MINLMEYVQVKIDSNDMTAYLYLGKLPPGEEYDYYEIVKFLHQNGVKAGVQEDMLRLMVNENIFEQELVVATGKPAVNGRDGCYEFKFNLQPSNKPEIQENGNVDYHKLRLVEIVEKDQLVAVYIPKKPGKTGYTVKGEILNPAPCADLPPLRGKSIRVSEDGLSYYATEAGKISYSLGRIYIDQVYTITGDVDLSVGNIDFNGDVDVMGNIKTGMTVKARGNITVDGVIEGAIVSAGKNILVKRGILGGNNIKITAGGNLIAKFVENANAVVDGDVQVDSIVNSDIRCFGRVIVHGKNSKIVGGHVKADKYVYAKNIGSSAGVKTEVAVGIDLSAIINCKELENRMNATQAELNKVETVIEKLKNADNEKANEQMIHLLRTKIELSSQLSKDKAAFETVNHRVEFSKNAEVIVESNIYPGSTIIVDGERLNVDDNYESIVFLRKAAKVLTRNLNGDDLDKKKI